MEAFSTADLSKFSDLISNLSPRFKDAISRDGFIYFVADNNLNKGLIKIGFTRGIYHRLRAYRNYLASPHLIAIAPGNRKLERDIHDWQKHWGFRMFGEWYDMKPEDIPKLFNHIFCDFAPEKYPLLTYEVFDNH